LEGLIGRSAAVDSRMMQDLQAEAVQVTTELIAAETASIEPGWSISPVTVRRDVDSLMVSMASGAVLGFMAGLVRALWWVPGRRQLATAVRRAKPGGIPVLATVDAFGPDTMSDAATLRGVERVVARQQAGACFALDTLPESRHLAGLLNVRTNLTQSLTADSSASAGVGSVVVVASTRTRVCRAAPSIRQLVAGSIDVRGLVLVRPVPGSRSYRRLRAAAHPGSRRGRRKVVQ